MKANELMIADWVRSSISGKAYQVLEIGDPFLLLDNPGGVWLREIGMKYRIVEPIPLTAEILEMNGMEHPLPKIEYYDMLAEGKQLVIEKSLERWHIRYGGCSNYVSNVHELQHALRLCGLNDLADNLKIEED